MFTLRNHFKIIIIYLLIFLGILFIFYNHKVIAMGNKYSNNNEISNDEEYAWHLQAEFAIQNELIHFKFDSDKKAELLNEKNAITAKINKYNKRKKNNQLLTTSHDQPESSQQNIISTIENNDNNSSDDNIQYMNLRKNYYHTPSIDKPESSKKNNYK
ncbi:MAG: SVM family protein [Candidatus Phytoplasma australasiaticum]|nr:SVM family protein [Candidatus Phytoplasma australasiaticum]MDV3153885.1 SVM family protein [Candidatus Phytoplasma australasiaticum]MDV3167744.1 SVM family protein [Candidatus Phytoplasma australasiaticum]MDV3181331.1 SVM family protein [Candidatus Phytoplasma australasiaticum]MDV3183357.1 SVM family protein [Candidatus Phytoplasma australasiaticum]